MAFVPTNLVRHYEADQITGVADGAALAAGNIVDLSPSGQNASSVTGLTYRKYGKNAAGLPEIEFDGVASQLTAPALGAVFGYNVTVIAVMQPDDPGNIFGTRDYTLFALDDTLAQFEGYLTYGDFNVGGVQALIPDILHPGGDVRNAGFASVYCGSTRDLGGGNGKTRLAFNNYVKQADGFASFSQLNHNLRIGYRTGTSYGHFKGRLQAFVVHAPALDDTQLAEQLAWFASKYRTEPEIVVVALGDSLLLSQGVAAGSGVPDLLARKLGPRAWVYNRAVSGKTCATGITDDAALLGAVGALPTIPTGTKIVAVEDYGINDLYFAASADTTILRRRQYAAMIDVLDARYLHVPITMIARGDLTYTLDNFQAVNVATRSDWRLRAKAVALADPAIYEVLGRKFSPQNATYYQLDFVHLTTTGYDAPYSDVIAAALGGYLNQGPLNLLNVNVASATAGALTPAAFSDPVPSNLTQVGGNSDAVISITAQGVRELGSAAQGRTLGTSSSDTVFLTSNAGAPVSIEAVASYLTGAEARRESTGELRRVVSAVKSGSWLVTLDSAFDTEVEDNELIRLFIDPAIVAAGGTGAGPIVFTVTVQDSGATPLAGAIVEMDDGVVYSGTSDSSGHVVFGLTAGNFQLRIFKAGYSFTPATIAVTVTAYYTATMTLIVSSPAVDPSLTTASLTAYDVNNNPAAGVTFQVALDDGPGTPGRSYPRDAKSVISNSSGVVSIQLLRLAQYLIRRQQSSTRWGPWKEFTTADASTTTIPEVLGKFH
jgi:lysophospholipase L1-like esterase